MIQKIKNIALVLASVMTLAVPMMVPVAAHAATDIRGNLCSGSNFDVSGTGTGSGSCQSSADSGKLNTLLTSIVNIISAIVGVVAVIMIIVGGFKYITSGGESSNVSGAKNTIIYAIIGLVIVALAQLIVHFVLNQASKIGG